MTAPQPVHFNPVHVVYADAAKYGDGTQPVQAVLALRADILKLANTKPEEIFLHRLTDELLGGAPSVLLECSDDFLAEVKKLPLYKNSHDMWPGFETARSDHGGPVDPAQLKRLLAEQTDNDFSLSVATWRLRGEILKLAQQESLGDAVLIRHVDGDRGFISLLCPDDFVAKIEALERCAKIVRPEDAARQLHHRRPKF